MVPRLSISGFHELVACLCIGSDYAVPFAERIAGTQIPVLKSGGFNWLAGCFDPALFLLKVMLSYALMT
jgi:hypothetical protein